MFRSLLSSIACGLEIYCSLQHSQTGQGVQRGCPTSENGLAAEPAAAAKCYSTSLLGKIRLKAENTSSAKLGFRPTRYRNQLDQRSVALLSALRCWLRLGSHRFVLLCRPRSPKPTEELHSSHWHWSSAGRYNNSSVHHNHLCVPRKKSARTAASMDSELEGARDNTCVWLLLQTFVMMHMLLSS